jgi:predicted alpha/beta-fold hydrolase
MAEACYKRGMIACVCNARGGSGANFTSAKISSAMDLTDVDTQVKCAKDRFSPTHIYIIGFSAGAYMGLEYCNAYDRVTACALVSHTFDPTVAARYIDRGAAKKLYRPVLLAKLRHSVAKNDFIAAETKEAVAAARTLSEFDSAVSAPQAGVALEEYYDRYRITQKLRGARCPVLLLTSADDPFTDGNALFPATEAQRADHTLAIRLRHGGHVAFLAGMPGHASLADRIVPEWLRAAANLGST